MILSNTNSNKDRGFTIVELLIVIVIIGILAAITIVSYTGISAKANTASAQSNASSFIGKSEVYFAEKGYYPAAYNTLTTAAASETFAVSGITVKAGVVISTDSVTTISYYRCPTANATGIAVGFWNYSTGVINYIHSGSVTNGTATTLGTGCVNVTT